MLYYGIVQHEKADEQPELWGRAVVSLGVSWVEHKFIQEAGGVTFTEAETAEEFADGVNFPGADDSPASRGIVPQARGKFSGMKVNGRRIYLPVILKEAAR